MFIPFYVIAYVDGLLLITKCMLLFTALLALPDPCERSTRLVVDLVSNRYRFSVSARCLWSLVIQQIGFLVPTRWVT